MFCRDRILMQSSCLRGDPRTVHGFSTRQGGVSTLPHTSSMNVAEGHGDSPETVRQNIEILARAVSGGMLGADSVVCAPQIHSAIIRPAGADDRGSGVLFPAMGEGDGFITDTPGVLLMIRVADCTPILFSAARTAGGPAEIVCAVHAGWRGTVAGIAAEAIRQIRDMGGLLSTVRCAVGPSIGHCCYEVQSDFCEAVQKARGQAFARAHIRRRDGKFFADVAGMNVSILLDAGLTPDQIDRSPHCTACAPDIYHSHRASGGRRGAMGALIGLLPQRGG